MMDIFLTVITVLVSMPAAYLLQFTSSPSDGDTVYACAGDTVQFPWRVSLASGETLTQIQWFHVAENRRLMALTAGGHFLAMADYDQRVSQLHNAGLRLSNVSMEDEGSYVTEVSGYDRSSKFTELHRTLVLNVQTDADAPRVSGGRLQVEQSPSAVRRSGQWHLELTCGTFAYRGEPPVSVVWRTPSDSTVQSSSHSGNKFHLLLSNPVRGGHYSCHILRDAPAAVCLSPNDTLLNAASVVVEETLARVILLEAKQGELEAENRQLKARQGDLEAENRQLKTELQQTNHSLLQQISLLHARNVAAHKSARQSSTHDDAGAYRAVDNNLDTDYFRKSCAHTRANDRDRHPWWRVDLGREFDVIAVVITNRGDCCGDRLRDFYVEVFTVDPAINPYATGIRCTYHSGAMAQGTTKTLRCARPSRGRYVKIRKNTEILELCEVQVIAPSLIMGEDL